MMELGYYHHYYYYLKNIKIHRLIIYGEGGTFCSGADFNTVRNHLTTSYEGSLMFLFLKFFEMF